MSRAGEARWSEYLFAACGAAARAVPYVGQVVEIIQDVHARREQSAQHREVMESMSRVQRTLADVLCRDVSLTLETLRKPNLGVAAIEQEVRNLYDVRRMGFSPWLFEGLLSNSSLFADLKRSPQTFGRVLADADRPRDDALYVFLDADRTRLLEVAPYTLQQLLANQARGVPEAVVQPGPDVFARAVAVAAPAPAPKPPTPTAARPATGRVVIAPASTPRPTRDPSPAHPTLTPATPADDLGPLPPPPADAARRALYLKASRGDADSMARLANSYDSGLKATSPDDRLASLWFRRAAEAGHVNAMFNLGVYYSPSLGICRDKAEGVRWYRRAADAGHAGAMNALGRIHERGRGVMQDMGEAKSWYRRAADLGNEKATANLKRLGE